MKSGRHLPLGSAVCLREVASSLDTFPLMHHKVVADANIVYSGYSDKKASRAFVAAGKSGAGRVTRYFNGVGVTFSYAVVPYGNY